MIVQFKRSQGYQVLAAIIAKFFGQNIECVEGITEIEELADLNAEERFKYLYGVWVKCREQKEELRNNTTLPPVLSAYAPLGVDATMEQSNQWNQVVEAVEEYCRMEFFDFDTNPETLKKAYRLLWKKDLSEVTLSISEVIATGRSYIRYRERIAERNELIGSKILDLLKKNEPQVTDSDIPPLMYGFPAEGELPRTEALKENPELANGEPLPEQPLPATKEGQEIIPADIPVGDEGAPVTSSQLLDNAVHRSTDDESAG